MLNEEENLTAEHLEEKKYTAYSNMIFDKTYQELEKTYEALQEELKVAKDSLEVTSEWVIATLEAKVAESGCFQEDSWEVRYLKKYKKTIDMERIEKIISANDVRVEIAC